MQKLFHSKKRKIAGLFFLVFYLFCQTANAQGRQVTGKVVDAATNEAVIGATVKVKGVASGVVTDVNGTFRLNAPSPSVLVVSFLGYTTKELSADFDNLMVIELVTDETELDEVVVVGYGTQRRSDVTGAIASVTTETLVRSGNNNAVGALQGTVSGVNIVRNNSKPGGGYSFDIRGLSSISSSNTPLVVVDGIPGADIDLINPADIDRIDILKDASATAIYGSRGANGVVIVTTKRGVAGKPVISYRSYAGFREYTNLPDMMSGPEYVQLAREAGRATNNNVYRTDEQVFSDGSERLAIQNGNYYNWVDAVSSSALQTSHTLSATGGTENSKYSVSGGYYFEDGMLHPQGYKRYNLRTTLDLIAGDVFNYGGSLYFTSANRETGNSDLLIDALRARPTQHPNSLVNGEQLFRFSGNGVFNPLVTQNNEFNNTKTMNVFGNVYLGITPITGLEFRSSFNPSLDNDQIGQYRGVYTKALQGTAAGGTNSLRKNNNLNWVWDNSVNYKWVKGIHNLNVLGVYSLQKLQAEGFFGSSRDLPFNSLWYNIQGGAAPSVSSSYSQSTLMSYLGRAEYNLMDKYLITVSARYDGSSKLAEGNKWALFPSAAVGWRLSEESFLKDVNWLSNLKLRLSYGQTGNDAVNPYGTTGRTSGSQYYSFGSDVIGTVPGNLRNPNLTWERSTEFNLGLDFGVFQNRLSGTVEAYNKLTTDLIMNAAVPEHLGFGSITDNVGSSRNKGIELTLNTHNIRTTNFGWSTNFVVSYNKNEIVDLAYKEDLGTYSAQLAGMQGDYANRWFIGQPIRTNWNLQTIGVWQLGEEAEAAKYGQRPGQFRVRDFDGDGVINVNKDRVLDGQRSPDWWGGFTNTFRYKNIDLVAQASWRTGARERNQYFVQFALENNNLNFNNLRKDYWTPENPSTTMGQPSNMGPYRDVNSTSSGVSHTFHSTDFLKINYITLGYTFNRNLLSRLKMSGLRLYATVQNPVIFTKFSGFDPEQPSVSPNTSDFMTRNVLFGLDVSF